MTIKEGCRKGFLACPAKVATDMPLLRPMTYVLQAPIVRRQLTPTPAAGGGNAREPLNTSFNGACRLNDSCNGCHRWTSCRQSWLEMVLHISSSLT
jgi:hypothetical protein